MTYSGIEVDTQYQGPIMCGPSMAIVNWNIGASKFTRPSTPILAMSFGYTWVSVAVLDFVSCGSILILSQTQELFLVSFGLTGEQKRRLLREHTTCSERGWTRRSRFPAATASVRAWRTNASRHGGPNLPRV